MAKNILIGILVTMVILTVGAILFMQLNKREARKIVKSVTNSQIVSKRPPPPKATPKPSPTPLPTPVNQKIARTLRVRPEDYPLQPVGKPARSGGKYRVTIEIQNRSKRDWPEAYVVLSSAYHPKREVYHLSNWKNNDTRQVDFVVDENEWVDRFTELRVEDVTETAPTEAVLQAQNAAGGASAGGSRGALLGLWGGTRRSLNVAPPAAEELSKVLEQAAPVGAAKGKAGVAVSFDGLPIIQSVEATDLSQVAGKDREVRKLGNDGVDAAVKAIDAIKALGEVLTKTPFAEAMAPEGPGTKGIAEFKKHSDEFFKFAVTVQQTQAREKTVETQLQVKRLEQASDVIRQYRDALQRQVRAAHPEFTLGD